MKKAPNMGAVRLGSVVCTSRGLRLFEGSQ
jgi:hypothetical protein